MRAGDSAARGEFPITGRSRMTSRERLCMTGRSLTWMIWMSLAVGPCFGTGPRPSLGAAAQPADEGARSVDEPYNPYKYVISADQAIQLFQDKVRRDPKDV